MEVQWSQIIPIPIDFAASGDNIIVPSKPSNSITLVKFFFVVGAATVLTFKQGAVEVSGPLDFTANMSMFADYDPVGWYWAIAGQAISLNSSNAVQVSGTAYYVVGR